MATESRYRAGFRHRIQHALDQLHHTATDAEIFAALRDACPLSDRKGYLYQIWLSERRIALHRRTGQATLRKRDRQMASTVLIGPHGVLCGWCAPSPAGCLACSDARRSFAAMHMKDRTMLRRLLIAALEGDEADRLVLADWHEEYGLIEDASWVREMWDVVVARRLLEMEEQG